MQSFGKFGAFPMWVTLFKYFSYVFYVRFLYRVPICACEVMYVDIHDFP